MPKKWIYSLPSETFPPSSSHYIKKNFILIADDMMLVDSDANKELWKYGMSCNKLKGIYLLIKSLHLHDINRGNLWFTKEGKVAFVDTKDWRPELMRIWRPYVDLSPAMKAYWRHLIEHGVPGR